MLTIERQSQGGTLAGDEASLIEGLRRAGFSRAAIDAAWPSWWSHDAAKTISGRTELRFALARKLGLDPRPLLGERVEFIWDDEARFKHLSTQKADQTAVLTAFGISVGRLLIRATPGDALEPAEALALRAAIMAASQLVDLRGLLSACWALRIPVIHLRVFPLETKSMHAMVVGLDGRYAVLLGRDANYPAPVAFTLGHELGHIMRGHLDSAQALVDLEDPALARDTDGEEVDADHYALTLLTGSPHLEINTDLRNFNAPTLARSVLNAAQEYGIEPGTLALCLGHHRKMWPVAISALSFIYSEKKPVWREVNGIAERQIDWDILSDDAAEFLRNVITDPDA